MSETRTPHQIDRRRAMEFLWNETGGQIFSVYFKKRGDHTMRKMTCRRGVKQGITGEGLRYDPKPKLLLPVFEMPDKSRRMVNLDGLVSFNFHGETFILV